MKFTHLFSLSRYLPHLLKHIRGTRRVVSQGSCAPWQQQHRLLARIQLLPSVQGDVLSSMGDESH